MITTNILGVRILRKFTGIKKYQVDFVLKYKYKEGNSLSVLLPIEPFKLSSLRFTCFEAVQSEHLPFLREGVHLQICFIIVFICDLFVSRDNPLMS